MLPKHLRLPAKLIPILAYKGRKSSHGHVEVRFLAKPELKYPLFAITVTTKASKNAVVRNRIRRKLKVKLEELTANYDIPKGYYIVLIRTPQAVTEEDNLADSMAKQIGSL